MENTVRIDLGNGAWAEVHREVLHRTYRLHEEILRRAMTPLGDTKMKMSDFESGKKPPKVDYVIDLALVDTHEVNAVYILNQVAAWSLGPVTHETIENLLTRDQCIILVREMDRLYQPIPLSSSGKGVLGLVRRFTAPSR